MSEILQSGKYLDGQHPDADQLSAFVERSLPADEYQETLVHLSDCADCRHIVALSVLPLEERPMVSAAEASPAWLRGWLANWNLARKGMWIGASALAALVLLMVFLQSRAHSRSKAEPPSQVAAMDRSPRSAPLPAQEKSKESGGELSGRDRPIDGRPPVFATLPRATAKPSPRPGAAADSAAGAVVPAQSESATAGLDRNTAPAKQRVETSRAGGVAGRGGVGASRASEGVRGGVMGGSMAGMGTAPAPNPSAGALARLQPPPSGSDAITQPGADSEQVEVGSNSVSTQSGRVIEVPLADRSTDEDAAQLATRGREIPPIVAGAALTGNAIRRNTPTAVQGVLPSGLSVLSFATSQRQRIAIDNGNQLFFSEDAGQHWHSVASPWRGRAIAVAAIEVSRVPVAVSQPQPMALAIPERYTPGESAVVESDMPSDSLSGAVTDASGASIPHATVTLSDSRTGLARRVETDGTGRYLVTNFVPGLYRMDIRAAGFDGQSLLADLSSAQQAVKNVTLGVGQMAEIVAVEVSNPQLVTEKVDRLAKVAKTKRSPAHLASQLLRSPLFVVTTDTGERWTSADGQSWKLE